MVFRPGDRSHVMDSKLLDGLRAGLATSLGLGGQNAALAGLRFFLDVVGTSGKFPEFEGATGVDQKLGGEKDACR